MAWQKGQSGNPGGRPAHQTKYLKSLVRLVKTDDWKQIVIKAIEQAKRGDTRAREWLANYCLGKPTQPVEGDFDAVMRFIVQYETDGLHDNPTETP